MRNIRWLGLAVILTIVAGFSSSRLPSPWGGLVLGLALALSCVALVQEVRRARR